MASVQKEVEKLLAKADIRTDGSREGDIIVHDKRFYGRVLREGSLGLGESYMDGWWDAPALDVTMDKVLRAKLDREVRFTLPTLWLFARAFLFNRQSRSRSHIVGEEHYDLGNDLYTAMLDSRMIYSCGYWKDAQTLDEAQKAKLDLICRKVGLKKGDHILDIGCGWGGFAKYAAETYGVSVLGITVSKEQAVLARKNCEGLPIEIRVCDYRELTEQFDHIISIGMFEHVGHKNYAEYFKVASRCLKDDGLFLLHTIGGSLTETHGDAWVDKYIFANGMLPSITQLGPVLEGVFVMEDWHNFGAYYDTTLMAWWNNFEKAWPALQGTYSERFYRMWKYYLLTMAGTFRARINVELWQIVLSKNGVRGGYTSVR